jgi:hypothetical protein
MPSQTKPLFEQLDTWMTELQEIKTAAAPKPSGQTKTAGPSGMGKTTHPSEKVENNTHNAPEGARYRENESDVKKDVPANVEEASDKMDEDRVMPNIGTQQAATGEQTSVERDFKGNKDDGTTSHPADAEDVGEKYSAAPLPKLLKMAEDKANALLADIGNGLFAAPNQSQASAQQHKQAGVNQAPAQQNPGNLAAGYATAATAGPVNEQQLQKFAADFIEQTVRDADLDADLVGAYLTSWQQKVAAEDEDGPKPPLPGGDEGGEGGPGGGDMPPPGMPPMAMGGGPGGPGGGGMPLDAGGGGMPPGGGMSPDAAGGGPAGADPLSALNAAAGDSAPSAGDKHQALQDLLMALQELGIDPSQLADLSQQAGPEAADKGAKLASAAIAFQRSGRFRFAEAKTAQQRKNRDMIKDYVMEIAGLKG